MMFGIMIKNIDLNAESKLFDIALTQEIYSSGNVLLNSTDVPLVQCTSEHFAFNEDLNQIQNKIPINLGLCPQIGQEVVVKGKYSSDLFAQLRVSVSRCNSSSGLNKTCANQS